MRLQQRAEVFYRHEFVLRLQATGRRIGGVPGDTPMRLTILLKPQAPPPAGGRPSAARNTPGATVQARP
jgi:hypothetical protein